MKISSKRTCKNLSECEIGDLVLLNDGLINLYCIVVKCFDEISGRMEKALLKLDQDKIGMSSNRDLRQDVFCLNKKFEIDIDKSSYKNLRSCSENEINYNGLIVKRDKEDDMKIEFFEKQGWLNLRGYNIFDKSKPHPLDDAECVFTRWSIKAGEETVFTFDAEAAEARRNAG